MKLTISYCVPRIVLVFWARTCLLSCEFPFQHMSGLVNVPNTLSAIIFSLWHPILVIETRAGTYPTLDPSWYGSGLIVLAVPEVDLALICASLPVFWPIIERNMGEIFVTREFEVEWETTRPPSLEAGSLPLQSTSPAIIGS